MTIRAHARVAPQVFLLVGLLISGCSPQPELSVEEQVGNRALQWAGALMSLDYDKALTFMTPSYQNSPRADRFRGEFSGAGFWKDAEIKWVKCDETSGAAAGQADSSTANSEASSSRPVGTISSEEMASDEAASDDIAADTITADSEDECVVTAWETCGQTFAATPPSTIAESTSVDSSARCEARLTLSMLKPPEMSFPMPIPYETVWLKIDGAWYLYRQ